MLIRIAHHYLWGYIKQKVYENNWSANNMDQLVLSLRNLDPENWYKSMAKI
jgi:hypothetical protein